MVKREQIIHSLYICIDIVCVVSSFLLAFLINFYHSPHSYEEEGLISFLRDDFPFMSIHVLIFFMWGIILLLLLKSFKLHQTARELPIVRECGLVVKALLYSTMPVATAIFILKVKMLSPLVFIEAFCLMLFFLTFCRILKRIFVRYLVNRGYNVQNVLIVGCNKEVENVVHEVTHNPYLGLRIIGIVCDNNAATFTGNHPPILGSIAEIENIIQKNFIDELLITSGVDKRKIPHLVLIGQTYNVTTKIIPDLHELLLGQSEMVYWGDLPVIQYYAKGIHGADLIVKRLFDIISSCILLLCCLPIFVIIGSLIKSEDGGPILFISKRSGKRGRVFNVYKFRTMIIGAERLQESLKVNKESTGPIFKIKNDPRITKIGKILRKYSLDELPQLVNVLRGDMSLVGPRPLSLQEIERDDMRQLKRLEIKPGITCLWQVQGRSDLSFEMLLKWDLWYLNNWSFWLDMKIIFLTIPAVLKGKGAY
ncbi:MAG: sugar transferase [Candidatus Omnitrophica bacterium]|nr:sugar transferase [Candidatus Omnitrophota bacterium]